MADMGMGDFGNNCEVCMGDHEIDRKYRRKEKKRKQGDMGGADVFGFECKEWNWGIDRQVGCKYRS